MILAALTLLVILLSFANGGNDVANGIATLVGSGVSDYKKAVVWGTIWTIAGAIISAFFALAMLKTFSLGGIVKSTYNLNEMFPLAVTLGALFWVSFATRTGLPVSTTHSITGSFVGAALAAFTIHEIMWAALAKKIFIPLAFSPIAAVGICWLFFPLIRFASSWAGKYCVCLETNPRVIYKPSLQKSSSGSQLAMVESIDQASIRVDTKNACTETASLSTKFEVLDILHWLSAGMTCFARGLNDAPKIAALTLGMYYITSETYVNSSFLIIAIAMGAGSYVWGFKVTETLSRKVTQMDHHEGLAANLTTSLLVGVAARFGLPVSTTQVSSGAIIGIGLKHGVKMIEWKTVSEILLAWLITLPVSAILAYFFFHILGSVM